jgi:non-specific serine/threonine protein kinase
MVECPGVTILATSREALQLTGETRYCVPPLSFPDPKARSLCGTALDEYEAIRLFRDRAAAVLPSFTLAGGNAAIVAQICRQLDGMPLALELAAARVAVMPLSLLAERLNDRFSLLQSGRHTSVPRHRTLRSVIDWSYDLLSRPEQFLLCRLSIFVGGWTPEAAECVCAGGGIEAAEVLGLLASLVEKSLVQYEGERYRLLETVRQYGRDRLAAVADCGRDERDELKRAHRQFFLRLAEDAESKFWAAECQTWLARLEVEHDNMRSALDGAVACGDEEAALRLGGALWRFWWLRGYWSEGRERLAQLLSLPEAAPRTAARARVLQGAGVFATHPGDYASARALLEESVAIAREVGEPRLLSATLNSLGNVGLLQGDLPAARPLYEERLQIGRALNDRQMMAIAHINLAWLAILQGAYPEARILLGELGSYREHLGDPGRLAEQYYLRGVVERHAGAPHAAQPRLEHGLALAREAGDQRSGVRARARDRGRRGSREPGQRELRRGLGRGEGHVFR